jgi:hypothetical protein
VAVGVVGEDLVFVKGVQGLQERNYPVTLATPEVRYCTLRSVLSSIELSVSVLCVVEVESSRVE